MKALKMNEKMFEIRNYDGETFTMHLTAKELIDDFDFEEFQTEADFLICSCKVIEYKFRFIDVCENITMDCVFNYDDMPELYELNIVDKKVNEDILKILVSLSEIDNTMTYFVNNFVRLQNMSKRNTISLWEESVLGVEIKKDDNYNYRYFDPYNIVVKDMYIGCDGWSHWTNENW